MIDLPITGGINFTSFVDRIIGVRIFAGVVPAFKIGVGNNDLGITKSDISTFNLHGQAGLGLDVAFLFFEAGFDFGFNYQAQTKITYLLKPWPEVRGLVLK